LSYFILSLGRIDKSDGFQLQPYIFVHLQNFDKDTLDEVLEDSGLKWKTTESGEVAISSISSDDKGEDTTSLLLHASTQLAADAPLTKWR
jgi:hypothetical protein